MFKKIFDRFDCSKQINFKKFNDEFDIIKINQGLILSKLNMQNTTEICKDIKKSEFKVFSQWGDDGIIDFLVNYLDISDTRFVEFGVENYTECNTKFLLMSKNWKGLIMDGSTDNMDSLKKSNLHWKYNIRAVDAFITKENINQLLIDYGFDGEIGILHIDIDGNDYWIWNEVNVANPIIVIVEYNAIFGCDKPYTIVYKKDFIRNDEHHSNLYYGTSLLSLCDLADKKGYYFVGCNSNANNAYFVRKDKIKDINPLTAKEGFVESQFSESRDREGNLNFLREDDKIKSLKGLKIFNTRTNDVEIL
jgi:hypothetical protein